MRSIARPAFYPSSHHDFVHNPLLVALHNHTTLESLARLQLLPTIHRTNLYADHVLVPVLWLKVTHSLCLLDPGIPHHAVLEIVADDDKAWLAILEDRCCRLLNGLVDAVGLAGDCERGIRLLVLAGVEDFVDVGGAAEAVDGDFVDVL